MYRNVLFTDKEIAILSSILNEYLYEKNTSQRANLTIILARLRQIKPIKKYNQTFNYGK